MDIGLLYQEYRRERKRSTGQHQHSASQQQQEQSTAQSALLRGIGRAMPSLLAPGGSPGSSRLTATSLPPSASDQPWPAVDGPTSERRTPQVPTPTALQQQPPPPPPPPPLPPPPEPADFASLRRFSPIAAKRKTTSEPTASSAAAAAAAAADPGTVSSRALRNVGTGVGTGRGQHRTATVDIAGRCGGHPLVAIDPRDVRSVLTQVVAATMRDLLGRDQDTRERSLLRQIRRTLGEFESSMAAIVNSFAAFRQQSDGHRACIVNNSAGTVCGGAGVASIGSGVCVSDGDAEVDAGAGVGVGATSSRDSGQSIRESCCPSDDRSTTGTRVPLVDSDSDCALPLRYRPLSSLGCPGCSGGVGGRCREQKNFNHASSDGSSRSSSSSRSIECHHASAEAGKTGGRILCPGGRDHIAMTASHLQPSILQQSFPRFPAAAAACQCDCRRPH